MLLKEGLDASFCVKRSAELVNGVNFAMVIDIDQSIPYDFIGVEINWGYQRTGNNQRTHYGRGWELGMRSYCYHVLVYMYSAVSGEFQD
jgi:hypothetical protein